MAGFCGSCGAALADGANNCGSCGAPVASAGAPVAPAGAPTYAPTAGLPQASSANWTPGQGSTRATVQIGPLRVTKLTALIAIVALVIVAIIGIGASAGGNDKAKLRTVQTMFDAYTKGDIQTIKKNAYDPKNQLGDITAEDNGTRIKWEWSGDKLIGEVDGDKITFLVPDSDPNTVEGWQGDTKVLIFKMVKKGSSWKVDVEAGRNSLPF